MQCDIRGMGDVAEATTAGADTLPKPGRVNEVCREWLVKEDGALACRLQNEEFTHHYTGNKFRNAQVREDFPRALDEQRREEKEAATVQAVYNRMVIQQEEYDANVAKQLAERIEWEERERRRAIEEEDEEIARQMQERECQHTEKRRVHEDLSQYHHDMNSVGLPLPPDPDQDSLLQQFRICTLSDAAVQTNSGYSSPIDVHSPQSPFPSEEQARQLQEEQDAEFARMLQEQEGGGQVHMLDQDRLLAIEAQDKELAQLLQERERAKAKRARERAKQRAQLKKQQQAAQGVSEDEISPAEQPSRPAVRPTELDLSSAPRTHRYVDPEAIEVMSSEPGPSRGLPNIAMAIDPTYPRRELCPELSSAAPSLPPQEVYDDDDDDDSPVPPYMPIQGQRRTATLETKGKKNKAKREGKDSCKQQ